MDDPYHVDGLTGDERSLRDRLLAAGVDFTTRPDAHGDVLFVARTATATVYIGGEPARDEPDRTWWTARAEYTDGEEATIYEGTDMAECVDRIAEPR